VFASCGTAEHVPAVVAILADEARGESVRTAAGMALAGILGRDGSAANAEVLKKVGEVTVSTAAAPIRESAARALALAKMDAAQRADILRQLQMGTAKPK